MNTYHYRLEFTEIIDITQVNYKALLTRKGVLSPISVLFVHQSKCNRSMKLQIIFTKELSCVYSINIITTETLNIENKRKNAIDTKTLIINVVKKIMTSTSTFYVTFCILFALLIFVVFYYSDNELSKQTIFFYSFVLLVHDAKQFYLFYSMEETEKKKL